MKTAAERQAARDIADANSWTPPQERPDMAQDFTPAPWMERGLDEGPCWACSAVWAAFALSGAATLVLAIIGAVTLAGWF